MINLLEEGKKYFSTKEKTTSFVVDPLIGTLLLTYKKYKVPVCLEFSDLGGAAEDSGEYSLVINIIGKGQEVSAAA